MTPKKHELLIILIAFFMGFSFGRFHKFADRKFPVSNLYPTLLSSKVLGST